MSRFFHVSPKYLVHSCFFNFIFPVSLLISRKTTECFRVSIAINRNVDFINGCSTRRYMFMYNLNVSCSKILKHCKTRMISRRFLDSKINTFLKASKKEIITFICISDSELLLGQSWDDFDHSYDCRYIKIMRVNNNYRQSGLFLNRIWKKRINPIIENVEPQRLKTNTWSAIL